MAKTEGNRQMSADQPGSITTAESWCLRYPGLIMGAHGKPVRDSRLGGENAAQEFNSMWGLKPDADRRKYYRRLMEPDDRQPSTTER